MGADHEMNDVNTCTALFSLQAIHPLAHDLNQKIQSRAPAVLQLFSAQGYRTYYPKDGIPAQAAEAKEQGIELDATVGVACQDDGTIMHLPSLRKQMPFLHPNNVFPYANAWGLEELRVAWKEQMIKKNPMLINCEISKPIVAGGLTNAIHIVSCLFCNPGDAVLIPNVRWDNYDLIFGNQAGGWLIPYTFVQDDRIDIMGPIRELKKMRKLNKAIIVLNFPNNPTGYTPTENEVKSFVSEIELLAKEGRKFVIICDDAYFGLTYDENAIKNSIFAYLCNLHENILVTKIDGISKEDYAWGLRIGFLTYGMKGANSIVYEQLADKAAAIIRATMASVNHGTQTMLLNAFKDASYDREKQERYNALYAKYLCVNKVLKLNHEFSKYFSAIQFNSGYFLSVMPLRTSAEDIRVYLMKHHKVGVVCLGNLLRICYARLPLEKIEYVFEVLTLSARVLETSKSAVTDLVG